MIGIGKEYTDGFMDIILAIPEGTVHMSLDVDIIDRMGNITKLNGNLGPDDIREAQRIFDEWEVGEYPRFTLTEKGEKFVEELANES